MASTCAICQSADLSFFAHTAACRQCGVLLYWPYPNSNTELAQANRKGWSNYRASDWYGQSSFFNHTNFTNMVRFVMDESFKNRAVDVLDYGGGGGQFALVCRSHFPGATVYITDITDGALLEAFRPFNEQILFAEFPRHRQTFDVIFLNNVFEHVVDPVSVLQGLRAKLKPGGRIFIDTPVQFWIYPVTKLVSTMLYTKVLKGTVSTDHLQISSKPSFEHAIRAAGLVISRYVETSEYTMVPDFYLDNMGIRNRVIRAAGRVLYRNARYLARNKIMSVVEPSPVEQGVSLPVGQRLGA